jgi:hypothetical protein
MAQVAIRLTEFFSIAAGKPGLVFCRLNMRFVSLTVLFIFSIGSWAEQVCDTSVYPLSAPSERFQDNGDGTVTDGQTTLMWMRCSVGQIWTEGSCSGDANRHSWGGAAEIADQVNRDGDFFFNDWRVPTLPELANIAERQCENPRINLDIFPRTSPEAYWTGSSRPAVDDDELAYALSFGREGVLRVPKVQKLLVRLVRTGP